MRIVQKYGGSSLANVERLRAAAQRISQLARQGVQVIVVVSAQGDTTDELIEKAKRLEDKLLPPDVDYSQIKGLRLEAQEKLNRIRPFNLGQAGRISGVNPADVSVLMVWLATRSN